MDKRPCHSFQDAEVRKGPWTMEEDLILINYIANHGEGVWNSLAKAAGLKRTGKSCRLRWLNYLRPDVRRGNITAEEQHLIMELHAKWGNRWSKIAKHLPGRTDNEIKNYWRTRIQKNIKQSENFHGQSSCSEMNDEPNTSLTSVAGNPLESYSPLSYQENFNTCPTPLPGPEETNDNYWSMDELWSFPYASWSIGYQDQWQELKREYWGISNKHPLNFQNHLFSNKLQEIESSGTKKKSKK